MYSAIFITLLGIGHLATGVPLEHPSEDLSQFFDSRIVGGSVAEEGRAPHMVGLLIGSLRGMKSFVCGGSLITYKHICTAAHCTDPFLDWNGSNGTLIESFHGVIGTNQWQIGQFIKFLKHIQHPQYNPWTYKNDIAILATNDVRVYGTHITPIAMDYSWVEGGVKCYVTGWGTELLWGLIPSHLKILYVEILDSVKCIETIKAIFPSGPYVDPVLEICTLHSVGNGMCHGDSGSALISKHKRKQIGVVAWGFPCANGLPDVFTRMSSHRKFVESSTK